MATPNAESTSDDSQAQEPSSEAESMFVEPELDDEPDRTQPVGGQEQFAQTYEEDTGRGSEEATEAPQGPTGQPQEEDNPDLPPGSETNPFEATSEEAGEVDTETPTDDADTDDPSAEESDADAESHKDDADAEENTEDDGVFYESEDENGSVYETADEARRGIEEKDRYIEDLESRVEDTEEQASEKVQELQSKLQEANTRLERFYEQLPEDRLEEMAIQEYMDEDYRGKSPDDFANDQELQKFYDARAEAKAEYRQDLKSRKAELENQQQAQKEAMENAKEFVEKHATPDFFGARAPEQKAKLRKLEQTPEDGHSDLQKAQYVAAAFGEEAGRIFLEGLKTKFEFAGGRPSPSKDRPSKTEETPKETAEKTTEQTKVQHRPTHQPPTDETPPMDDREEAKHVFKRNVQDGVVDV